jgi:uncharacterized membrane protein
MNRITSAIEAVHMDDLHSTESQFRLSHPWCWRFTLFGPIVLTALLLVFLFFQTGWEFTTKIATAAAMTVMIFGRFIILSGTEGAFQDTNGSLASEHLFAIVCYLDVMTALMLAFHIGFMFRLPYVGPRISALVTDGHFILDSQPWMRRATFFGLIAFVGFPLAATGSIGGSIFGRLLGMSRTATFFGIVIGALLGNTVMFLFSDLLSYYFDKNNIYLKIGGFLVIAAVIFVLERRYRKLKEGFAKGKLPLDQPHVDYGIPGDDHIIDPIERKHSTSLQQPATSPASHDPSSDPLTDGSYRNGAVRLGDTEEFEDLPETVSGTRSGSRPHPR